MSNIDVLTEALEKLLEVAQVRAPIQIPLQPPSWRGNIQELPSNLIEGMALPAKYWSTRQIHLYSASAALRKCRGVGWRKGGKYPTALLTWVQHKAGALFAELLATQFRLKKSQAEICTWLGIDLEAAAWLIARSDELKNYTEEDRRVILLAWIDEFLSHWDEEPERDR